MSPTRGPRLRRCKQAFECTHIRIHARPHGTPLRSAPPNHKKSRRTANRLQRAQDHSTRLASKKRQIRAERPPRHASGVEPVTQPNGVRWLSAVLSRTLLAPEHVRSLRGFLHEGGALPVDPSITSEQPPRVVLRRPDSFVSPSPSHSCFVHSTGVLRAPLAKKHFFVACCLLSYRGKCRSHRHFVSAVKGNGSRAGVLKLILYSKPDCHLCHGLKASRSQQYMIVLLETQCMSSPHYLRDQGVGGRCRRK